MSKFNPVCFSLTESDETWVRAEAQRRDLTMSQVVRKLIREAKEACGGKR